MSFDPLASSRQEPLGHGDHWGALGLHGEDTVKMLMHAIRLGRATECYPSPWPDAELKSLIQYDWPQESITFTGLVGVDQSGKVLCFLSAFPVLHDNTEWLVQVDAVLDSYGPYEGVVDGKGASGPGLQWFAPHFGRPVANWRRGGLAPVGFAALALGLDRFTAEPIVIRDGPLIEAERRRLRADGKFAEADDPTLSITFRTDQLRTFFALERDHHEFFGRILAGCFNWHDTIPNLTETCVPRAVTRLGGAPSSIRASAPPGNSGQSSSCASHLSPDVGGHRQLHCP